MEILIAHGVDLDLEIPKLGTPLYISCVSQKVHCVERLLQLGLYFKRKHFRDH